MLMHGCRRGVRASNVVWAAPREPTLDAMGAGIRPNAAEV